jgi:hypothetical protein
VLLRSAAATDTPGVVWLLSATSHNSKSKLLYDWRFTANQLVLMPSPSRFRTRDSFLQLNPCGHSNIFSDERMKLSLMNRLRFAFVKCTYRT